MKKLNTLILGISIALTSLNCATAQVKVGNNPNTLNPSAMLEVEATNKGFLPPRVALTGINDATTIPSPAKGLLVYNSGTLIDEGLYNNTGTSTSPIWSKVMINNSSSGADFNKMIYRGTTLASRTLVAGVFEWRYIISGGVTILQARLLKAPSSTVVVRGNRIGWSNNGENSGWDLGINTQFTSSDWNTFKRIDGMVNNTSHHFYLDVSGADEGKFYRVSSYVIQNVYNSVLIEVF